MVPVVMLLEYMYTYLCTWRWGLRDSEQNNNKQRVFLVLPFSHPDHLPNFNPAQ